VRSAEEPRLLVDWVACGLAASRVGGRRRGRDARAPARTAPEGVAGASAFVTVCVLASTAQAAGAGPPAGAACASVVQRVGCRPPRSAAFGCSAGGRLSRGAAGEPPARRAGPAREEAGAGEPGQGGQAEADRGEAGRAAGAAGARVVRPPALARLPSPRVTCWAVSDHPQRGDAEDRSAPGVCRACGQARNYLSADAWLCLALLGCAHAPLTLCSRATRVQLMSGLQRDGRLCCVQVRQEPACVHRHHGRDQGGAGARAPRHAVFGTCSALQGQRGSCTLMQRVLLPSMTVLYA